jgi:hypothetical protein
MPSYDPSYHPPAPVAQVMLRDMNSVGMTLEISVLLDTGADITLLPRLAVERLGIKPLKKEYELLGFDGNLTMAQAAELDMVFLNKAYRGRYLLINDDRGILGRDVLGSVALLLHGPRQEWSEQNKA